MSIFLWLLYLLGQAMHVLKRAAISAASTVSAGSSIREWFCRNWPTVVVRVFLNSALFLLWATPWLDLILDKVGAKGLVGKFPVPTVLNPQTAFIAMVSGFAADSLIDALIFRFVPSAQKEIPTYVPDISNSPMITK